MNQDGINTLISPGEFLDKITILEIKSERISDEAKLKNIRYELDTLNGICSKEINMTDTLNTLKANLKAINEELWEIEDDIRIKEKSKAFDDEFIRLARAVYVTNDKRAEVKKDINLELKSALVEEKSYEDYQ